MRTRTIVAALFVAVVGLPVLPAGAADCTDIEAKIAAAKTAADHEAIADCYDAMAKDAQAKADEHAKMGAAYRKEHGPSAGKFNLPQHCDQFVKAFRSEAKTYGEMANAHRQMAKSVK